MSRASSHGRRVTSDVDLEIVQWTLRGALNMSLVAGAARHGLAAVGLSGADGGTLRVTKRPPWEIDGETVDFGWVGDVEHVDVGLVETLLSGGFVPVLSPLGLDAAGQNLQRQRRHRRLRRGRSARGIVVPARD